MANPAVLQGLLDNKREYTDHLTDVLTEQLLQVFSEGYEELRESQVRRGNLLAQFQNWLAKIPEWNAAQIRKVFQRIEKRSGCSYLGDLVKGILVTYVKIQAVAHSTPAELSQRIKVRVPTPENFVHSVAITAARRFWKQPYLFYHDVRSLERQQNLLQAEAQIKAAIRHTLRAFLPMKQMMEYLPGSAANDGVPEPQITHDAAAEDTEYDEADDDEDDDEEAEDDEETEADDADEDADTDSESNSDTDDDNGAEEDFIEVGKKIVDNDEEDEDEDEDASEGEGEAPVITHFEPILMQESVPAPAPESESESDSDTETEPESEPAVAVAESDSESEPTSPIAATEKDLAFLDEPHSPIHKSLTIDSLRNARDNETFSLQKAARAESEESEESEEPQTQVQARAHPAAPRSERSVASSRADVRIIPFPGMLVNKNKLRRSTVTGTGAGAVLTRTPRGRAEGAFF